VPNVSPGSATKAQKQHVEFFRKTLLRKHLLMHASDGPAYVPFIGDGDLAVELYQGRRDIYGADLDADRVAMARSRLRGADVRMEDCDSWPFPDLDETFAIADFDAYVHPYRSFRAFWAHADRQDRVVLFFTDGQRQGIKRSGVLEHPGGTRRTDLALWERRRYYNAYLERLVWPWFREFIAPWRMQHVFRYLRQDMVYWGAVIDR
jgi:hypothetical protein